MLLGLHIQCCNCEKYSKISHIFKKRIEEGFIWKLGKKNPPPLPPPKQKPQTKQKSNKTNQTKNHKPKKKTILLKDIEIWAIYLGGGTLENEVGVGAERICLPDLQKCNTSGLFNTLSKQPYSFKNER